MNGWMNFHSNGVPKHRGVPARAMPYKDPQGAESGGDAGAPAVVALTAGADFTCTGRKAPQSGFYDIRITPAINRNFVLYLCDGI
jgi:hypothetical protein